MGARLHHGQKREAEEVCTEQQAGVGAVGSRGRHCLLPIGLAPPAPACHPASVTLWDHRPIGNDKTASSSISLQAVVGFLSGGRDVKTARYWRLPSAFKNKQAGNSLLLAV